MASIEEKYRRAFAETCDPHSYIPRDATEAALLSIRRWIESSARGSTLAALVSSPGLGKTQLLRVVEAWFNARSQGSDRGMARIRRALYLPYAGLSPTDLSCWVLGLLGIPPDSMVMPDDDPSAIEALMALGRGFEDPFLLILDDADSMPAETLEALVERLPIEASPLKILIGLNMDSKASRLLAALHPLQSHDVLFRRRMNVAETAEYLRGRMRWAGFSDEAIARIDEEAAERIHSLSSGIPRRVHAIATTFFESEAQKRPDELEVKSRREHWMGRPIEDDFGT